MQQKEIYMTNTDNTPAGSILCKACGLCCKGIFHQYVGLETDEVPSAEYLGLEVVNLSTQTEAYNFILPCHLWHGQCSIYNNPNKPATCGNYRCKLLKDLQKGDISLDQALSYVKKTTRLITELEVEIPTGQNGYFIGRIIALIPQLEGQASSGKPEIGALLLNIGILLAYFSRYFGVMDIFNQQISSKQQLEKLKRQDNKSHKDNAK